MTHRSLFLATILVAALLPVSLFAENRVSAEGEPLHSRDAISGGDPRDGTGCIGRAWERAALAPAMPGPPVRTLSCVPKL